ncbi:hypothetical protein [Sphingobium lactosutens]|nr:hypothetical protein [Sphingobium lactosutens]
MAMIDKRVRDTVLSIVLQEQDRSSADWSRIEADAFSAIKYINENNVVIDNLIYHFLEDVDARRKSEAFALHQTAGVLKMLEA